MRKFKKKKAWILLASLTSIIVVVVVGISVLAEDGTIATPGNQGSTTETEFVSCLNDPDVEKALYDQIEYSYPTRSNSWVATFSNLPSDAKVLIYDNGLDNAPSIKVNDTTESWNLSIPLPSGEQSGEIEIRIYPQYFDTFTGNKAEDCSGSYLMYTINPVIGSTDVTLDDASKAQEDIFRNLLGQNTENNFVANNADYTQTQKLVCSYDPNVTKNEATFTSSREVQVPDNPYCKKNCQETITVTYGPPIATEAGMGLEYEVTVTSKVECESVTTGSLPSKPKVCVPTPDCNGGIWHDSHNEKAGPNEEFDSCILSCDGGEYGQACINQCYQQVYKKSSANTPLLAYTAFDVAHGSTRTTNPLGRYVQNSDGTITWISNQPECKGNKRAAYGNCAGFYYYRNAAQTNYWNGVLDIQRSTRSYFIDSNGFIRGQYSNGVECNSKCTWRGCEGNSGEDYYLTQAEANEKYRKDLETATEALQACKAEPEVSVDTTTYTITVENPKGTKTSFSTTNGSYKKSMLEKDDTDPTKGTYRFPTAYIDPLNGEVKYALTSNTSQYQLGGNRFYTSLLSNDTNTKWYDVKVNGVSLDTFNSETGCNNQQNQECNKIDYNILAQIKDYGFLEWDIDISCFYALKSDGTPPDDTTPEPDPNPDTPGDDNPNGGNPSDPKYMNYIFRPISLNKVFPTSEQYPLGRSPRWNWSCGATNTRNLNYPINPVSFTNQIESKNDSIYTDDQELDYEIILDRQTMNRIRDYNDKQDSYLDYDMTCKKVNGMTFCESNFLDNTSIFGDNVRRRGKIGCNNQIGEECDTSVGYSSVQSCITYFGDYDITTNTFK